MNPSLDAGLSAPPQRPQRLQRRRWPLRLALGALLMLLLGAWMVGGLWQLLGSAAGGVAWGGLPVDVVINGHDVGSALRLDQLPPAHRVMLVLGLAALALMLAVVLPVALLAAGVGLLLVLLTLIGLPLLAVLLVLGLLALPLLLPLLLLWWALR